MSDKEYIKKEWRNLCNFPKITILDVSIQLSCLISENLDEYVDVHVHFSKGICKLGALEPLETWPGHVARVIVPMALIVIWPG